MTNKEAIAILERMQRNSPDETTAVDMAIDALRTLDDAKGTICNIIGGVLHRMHGQIDFAEEGE